jgi:hypothetical protein
MKRCIASCHRTAAALPHHLQVLRRVIEQQQRFRTTCNRVNRRVKAGARIAAPPEIDTRLPDTGLRQCQLKRDVAVEGKIGYTSVAEKRQADAIEDHGLIN